MGTSREQTWFRPAAVVCVGLILIQGVPLRAFSSSPFQAPTKEVAAYGEVFRAKPGVLSGRILYPDGLSRAGGAEVRVWDCAAARFVCETDADVQGLYATAALTEGQYLAVYGDRVYVPLVVSEEAQLCSLDVVIPRGKVHFAPRELQAAIAALADARALASVSAGPLRAPATQPAKPAVKTGPSGGGPKLLPAILVGTILSMVAVTTLAITGDIGPDDGDRPAPASPSSP
ncbi:MAG: hypothetical protein V2A58_00210 [Planctomycetota bacterium]